jgi:hypothetical protein
MEPAPSSSESEWTSTTIGLEPLFNPLAWLDRVPFVTALTDAVPARPLQMVTIGATGWGLSTARARC